MRFEHPVTVLTSCVAWLNSLPATWDKQLLTGVIIGVLDIINDAAFKYLRRYNKYVKVLRKYGDELSPEDARTHKLILEKIEESKQVYHDIAGIW